MGLRPSDYDGKVRTIRVQRASGKGEKSRVVSIAPVFAGYVGAWLERRKAMGINGKALLLCQLDGSPWSPQAASMAIKYAGARAGIDKRLNPHSFRHAHAVRLDEAGVRSSLIQRSLGHSNLAVTTRYLQGISAGDLAEAVDGVEWGLEVPA
jgi:site-specific recombinase XerD